MKKIALSLSLLSMMSLNADMISVGNDWTLAGAVSDISIDSIKNNSTCVKSIWQYDASNTTQPWMLWHRDGTYNYPSIPNATLTKGSGFWVLGDGNCNIYYDENNSIDDNTSNFTPDMNTTDIATNTWTSFTNAISIEDDMDKQYAVWDINISQNPITAVIRNKEYDEGQWNENEVHNINVTSMNSDYNISIAESSEGFEADVIIVNTRQITSINGMSFTDLYENDIEFHVTNPGSGWTDTWDWAPSYWDGTQEVNVTTNDELKYMFLTQNNWFSDDYAMLDGDSSATSGDIVSGHVTGTFTCDNDGDGSQDDICENVKKTNNVIGDWSYDADGGIHLDLSNEQQTLSIVSDSSSPTSYFVQSVGQDKVGSVWKEKLYTGSQATESLTQQLMSY